MRVSCWQIFIRHRGCSAVAPLSAIEAKRHKTKKWLEITSEFSKPPALDGNKNNNINIHPVLLLFESSFITIPYHSQAHLKELSDFPVLVISCWINICGCSKVSCAVIGKACEADGDKIRHNLGPWKGNLKGGKAIRNSYTQFSFLDLFGICEIHFCQNTVCCMESRFKYGSVKSSVLSSYLVDSPQTISKLFQLETKHERFRPDFVIQPSS